MTPKRKRQQQHWWASFAVFSPTGWRFTDTVSRGVHPFKLLEEWGDPAIYGMPTLLSWREITRGEYMLHGEHLP